MFWRGWKSRELAPVLARTGCPILLSPTQTSYFDYYQGEKMLEPVVYAGLRFRDVYGFRPYLAGVPAGRIRGGQANLWTEQVQSYRHAEYMTFPRLLALSARLWENESETPWESWFPAAYAHMQRLERDGFRVSHAVLDPVLTTKTENGRRLVVLGSEVPGTEIRYTIDESMPDSQSPLYREPFAIPEGAVTLRVQAFHSGRPVGNLLVFPPDVLKSRLKP
jgi:hexosaminidase